LKKKKGFTLIELLVVIAVVALLMSVILPSLKKAKELARSIACRANLHSLAICWTLYSEENNREICSSYTYDTINNWGLKYDWVWAPYRLDGTGSADEFAATKAERCEGIRRGALFPYGQDYKVYHCPSDKFRKDSNKYRTYSIPDCIGGISGIYAWPVANKMTQLKNLGSKYIFVEEDDDRGYNMNSWILSPISGKGINPAVWNDPYLTVWHNRTSNLAFADGHVDNRKWSPETADYFSMEQFMGLPWGSFSPSTPGGKEDLQWMIQGWAD
jgi:prepilin-type N-terminal cleavage/methylation domain-containing protein/prepilin-type processing-associated H-X9-DG protein